MNNLIEGGFNIGDKENVRPQKLNWSEYKPSELNTHGHIAPFLANGWKVKFHYKDVMSNRVTPSTPPHFPVSFEKGIKRVWRIRVGWQVADLIDHKFCNHNPIKYEDVFNVILNEHGLTFK